MAVLFHFTPKLKVNLTQRLLEKMVEKKQLLSVNWTVIAFLFALVIFFGNFGKYAV